MSNPFTSKSAFLIAKFIESVVGRNYEAKRLTSGEILIEINNQAKSKHLLEKISLAILKSVTPHRTPYTPRSVTSEFDLKNETDSKLLGGLRAQSGIAVKRVILRTDSIQITTDHIILTFDRSTLPGFFNAGFL